MQRRIAERLAKFRGRAALVALVAMLTACTGAGPRPAGDEGAVTATDVRAASEPNPGGVVAPSTVSNLETHRLRAGDVVRISVWNNAELSREVTIGPDGTFQYPFAGEIEASGRTLAELERTLSERLAAQVVSPQVSVSLAELRSYRIYVTGQVTRPGAFDLHGPVSVVQAIAMAGGFTPFAARSDVLLYNPVRDAEPQRFDYRRFLADPAAEDALLAPGDTLIVR
jgi:polysaccharide export outer membrane protein